MSSYGLWLSAAGMKVQDHRQAVFANNLANANTTGFKQDLSMVTQREIESRTASDGFSFTHPVLDDLAGGLNVRPTYPNLAQGPIEWTGEPLDAAIQGRGFFAVSDGSVTRYTRDGQFTLNAAGEMVMAVGDGRWKVLDEAGSPITIDEAAGPVSISTDGSIRQGRALLTRLGLVDTQDVEGLRKIGANLFEATSAAMIPIEGRVVPQSREESNVDVMNGLVTMIEASRAYQLNANMLQLQDQATGQAVSTVGRLA